MSTTLKDIENTRKLLSARLEDSKNPSVILRSKELKELYGQIPKLPAAERAAYGKAVNELKTDLQRLVTSYQLPVTAQRAIDVTAPFDVNVTPENRPTHLPSELGSQHPLMVELDNVLDIFTRMGFDAIESRQLDDDWHMFTSLNFPEDHPARDDYDTFITTEGLVAPAHTSTMQNRVLKTYKPRLKVGEDIRVVIPGRVFRNEDLDARHEHTFYQLEGVVVGRGIHAGNLIATLKTWLNGYYGKDIDIRIQPFYFPFTEPSFEFATSCIFCVGKGCSICSQTGWIELGGCGMIHPNVLKLAGIDASFYTGFAWGFGIERLVMLKYGIEDVRLFHSGKLDFLRQF